MAGMNLLHSLVVTGLVILFLAVPGCTDVSSQSGTAAAVQPSAASVGAPVEKVEVYHFHGNQQCTSCIAVGDLAEKTVNANFKSELASGQVVFAHVNAEQPENAALATKYGVTGSSLWIGVYDANGFHREQDTRVWYLINNKDAYSAYLTDLIAKRLNGNLS